MRNFKKFLLLIPVLLMFAGLSSAQQTVYTQSIGPLTAVGGAACTASTGVATSSANTPCGGQGSMFQNSLVTSMTLSWTSVATVSSCTVQLEQATTLTGTYTLLGTAQTCTSSGTYTATLSAAYVRFNITALTTTTGSVIVNYFGQIGNTPQNVLSSVMLCGTAPACSPSFQTGARVVYGSCLAAAATTCTVTGIAPAFNATGSYFCAVTDATTAANAVLKVANASSSSFVITDTNSSSDVFNYVCVGF